MKRYIKGIDTGGTYTGAAARLATTVSFTDHCEVGNAVGAALLAKGAGTFLKIH